MIISNRYRKKSRKSGQQLVEFSAALILLVIGIFIPLLDLGVLPLRWILWQEALNTDVRRLAQSESFSKAITSLDTDGFLSMRLGHISGVKLLNAQCALIISTLNSPYETYTVQEPKSIKAAWLPGGAKSPCLYELEITSVIELSPLILLQGFSTSIPGLTKPFICTTKARAHWENYGRDPSTKQFFMNE